MSFRSQIAMCTWASLYGSHAEQIREDLNELELQAKIIFPADNYKTPLRVIARK